MVTIKDKKRKSIKVTESTIEDFISSSTDLPKIIRCVHLKNKPMMYLSVCLKKFFVWTDKYTECKGCKQLSKYMSRIERLGD